MRKALPAFLLVGGAVATIYAFTWQRPAAVAVAVLPSWAHSSAP
jgi:hypothetical protein